VKHAVEGRGLAKTFVKKRTVPELLKHPFRRAGRIRALESVDLQVREGEIFGLLGPNGAGKTTLLKILSCLVLPDEGEARVGGVDVRNAERVKPRIGLVNSDERSFYWRLSGRENLRFFATLYDVAPRDRESRIEELLEKVQMADAGDRRFADYSSGMKQRLAVARALLHDPPILFMDEPTRSLDPASSLALRGFIDGELRRRDGKTILLATHNLREAEALCDRLAILVGGRIREVGSVSQVRRWGLSERLLRVEVERWPPGTAGPFRAVSDEPADGSGRRVVLSLHEGASLNDVLTGLIGAGVVLRSCDRVEPDLEEAFSRILGADADPEREAP
jgi:ABC-2 type transport system ATP-binding protein